MKRHEIRETILFGITMVMFYVAVAFVINSVYPAYPG